MSEIKGQILGIVLVLAVFGVVAGTLYNAFVKSAKDVGNKVSGATSGNWTDANSEGENGTVIPPASYKDVDFNGLGNLTF